VDAIYVLPLHDVSQWTRFVFSRCVLRDSVGATFGRPPQDVFQWMQSLDGRGNDHIVSRETSQNNKERLFAVQSYLK
jgi:hypothetical protein